MENSLIVSARVWTVRYAAVKHVGLGGVPAARNHSREVFYRGRVLIPGCGSGYELQAFQDAGYDVSGIDFSPTAVDHAKSVLGDLGERVILGDFFTRDFGKRRFDLIYERTFLCSMTPSRWPLYVQRTADLLVTGGRLIGVFLHGQSSSSGPPFPLTNGEAGQLFEKRFQLIRSDTVSDSLPLFRGMERWQEWLKTM